MNITDQERAYLALRAEGKSRADACRVTEYKEHKAIKLDEREDCMLYVASIKKLFMVATGLTSDYVLANLQRIYEKAMEGYWIDTGQGSGYQKYEYGPALKALEMMGKHLGMFTDKVEVNHTHEVTLINQVSLDDAKKALLEDTSQAEIIEVKPLEEGIEHLPESNQEVGQGQSNQSSD